MGLIKSIYGRKIFLDTTPLIHYIEGNNVYVQKLNELFSVQVNNFSIVRSSIFCGHTQAQEQKPYKQAALFKMDTLQYLEYNFTERASQCRAIGRHGQFVKCKV